MVKRRPAAFSGGFPYRDGARRASLPRANARLLHIAAPGVAPDNPKNAEPFVDGVVFDNHLDGDVLPHLKMKRHHLRGVVAVEDVYKRQLWSQVHWP